MNVKERNRTGGMQKTNESQCCRECIEKKRRPLKKYIQDDTALSPEPLLSIAWGRGGGKRSPDAEPALACLTRLDTCVTESC